MYADLRLTRPRFVSSHRGFEPRRLRSAAGLFLSLAEQLRPVVHLVGGGSRPFGKAVGATWRGVITYPLAVAPQRAPASRSGFLQRRLNRAFLRVGKDYVRRRRGIGFPRAVCIQAPHDTEQQPVDVL